MLIDIEDEIGLYKAPPCGGFFPRTSAILTPALAKAPATKLGRPRGPSFFCPHDED